MTNSRTLAAICLTMVVACLLAVVFSRVSGHAKLLVVMGGYVALAGLVVISRLSWSSVGLSRDMVWSGMMAALPIVVLIFVVLGVVFFVYPDIFRDSRYDLAPRALLPYVLLVMPFVTVVLEELLFRGVMLGVLGAYVSQAWAVFVSALAFGLWHIFSAGGITVGSASALPRPMVVVGVILATTAAGVFLGWIRLRSQSLLAPILIHWAINASAVFYAFLAWRK